LNQHDYDGNYAGKKSNPKRNHHNITLLHTSFREFLEMFTGQVNSQTKKEKACPTTTTTTEIHQAHGIKRNSNKRA
jgi:hypothetical protein